MHPILDQELFAPQHRMVSVEGLGGEGAHSGTAFRVVDADGKAYKLRDCGSEARAREIERYVRALSWLFPGFVARDGRYLLTDLLASHRPFTRHELLARADRVGVIAARLHAAGRDGQTVPTARRLGAAAMSLGRFGADLFVVGARSGIRLGSMLRIARKVLRRLVKYGIPIELELDDVHKDNFMWRPEDDDLRYVDEEAVGLAPRGLSMATLLKTANLSDTQFNWLEHWPVTPEVAGSSPVRPTTPGEIEARRQGCSRFETAALAGAARGFPCSDRDPGAHRPMVSRDCTGSRTSATKPVGGVARTDALGQAGRLTSQTSRLRCP